MASAYAVQPIVVATNESWRPFGREAREWPLPATDKLSREAKRLSDAWLEANENLEACNRAHEQANAALAAAREEYEVEVRRSGAAGDSPDRALELRRLLDVRRDQASEGLHGERIQAATWARNDAQSRYRAFLDEHGLELVAGIEQEAEQVAAQYREVNEEIAKLIAARLGPLQTRHAELVEISRYLVGGIEPFRRDDVPEDFSRAPYPTAESLARHEAFVNPPAEPDEADAEA